MKEVEGLHQKLAYAWELLIGQKIEPDDFHDLIQQYTAQIEKLEARIAKTTNCYQTLTHWWATE